MGLGLVLRVQRCTRSARGRSDTKCVVWGLGVYPKPETRNLKPCTLYPAPEAETLHPELENRNPDYQPLTPNPKPQILSRNPESSTPNPNPQTDAPHPKHHNPNTEKLHSSNIRTPNPTPLTESPTKPYHSCRKPTTHAPSPTRSRLQRSQPHTLIPKAQTPYRSLDHTASLGRWHQLCSNAEISKVDFERRLGLKLLQPSLWGGLSR